MKIILKRTRNTRPSHRYQGYIRVYNLEFRRALVTLLRTDAADLVEMMGLTETLNDLSRRIECPADHAAADLLTRSILEEANAPNPMKLPGEDFNTAAEKYYRHPLRERHIREALDLLEQDFRKIDGYAALGGDVYREIAPVILGDRSAWEFLLEVRDSLVSEEIDDPSLNRLIQLMILSIHHDIQRNTKDDTP